jgi:hypothetical protein
MDSKAKTPATVYEFYGSPGAGKTYVARQLASRILPDSELVSFHGKKRHHRFLIKILRVLRHPGILNGHFFTIFRIIKLHNPRPTEFIKLFYNMSFICGMMYKAHKGQTLVLDQGLIQAEWSNIYHGRTLPNAAHLLKYYAKLIEQLRVKSLLVVDINVCHDVVKARIGSRDHGESPLDNGGNWIRAQEALDYVASFTESLEENCPAVRRVAIDNSGDGISHGDIEGIVLPKVSTQP